MWIKHRRRHRCVSTDIVGYPFWIVLAVGGILLSVLMFPTLIRAQGAIHLSPVSKQAEYVVNHAELQCADYLSFSIDCAFGIGMRVADGKQGPIAVRLTPLAEDRMPPFMNGSMHGNDGPRSVNHSSSEHTEGATNLAIGTGNLTIVTTAIPEDGTDFVFTSNVADNAFNPIDTLAGTGIKGFSGDGSLATDAQLNSPGGVEVDEAGNFFIADTGNHRIRRVDVDTGIIRTVAGTGVEGFSGDGGLATDAQLNIPFNLAVDNAGNLFIADTYNHRIRRVDVDTGIIRTVAGTGVEGFSGDGGLATDAQLAFPLDVTVDGAGNLIIADVSNHRIRRVDVDTGIIRTIAGTEFAGFSGDGGPAIDAQLDAPGGVAVDTVGNIFIAEFRNQRIRRVDVNTGIIRTVAGNGTFGEDGDGGPATDAQLSDPFDVAVDEVGNLFIADELNSRVRYVDAATGIISTVAGTGEPGFSGDGGPATDAQLRRPTGVGVDSAGNLFIADESNNRIRQVVIRSTDFTLDVDNDPTHADRIVFEELPIGTYAITEVVPPGWQLDSASCTGGSDRGSLRGETLSVILSAGENIVCTFTNSLQTGRLTVVKEATPKDGTDFTFSGDLGSFTLDDASLDDGDAFTNTTTFTDLISGVYTITETLPLDWQLDSVICIGGSDGGRRMGDTLSVALGAGENVTCTFTNRRSSSLPTDVNAIYLPFIISISSADVEANVGYSTIVTLR